MPKARNWPKAVKTLILGQNDNRNDWGHDQDTAQRHMPKRVLQQLIHRIRQTNRARLRRRRAPERLAYQQWVAQEDCITPERRIALEAELAALSQHTLISVLMPVYNADLTWLKAAVGSVQSQIYPHWELCIADDCSTQQDLLNYLRSLPEQDARIKVRFRTTNGHISACSNSALALCAGTHVALLDQDDLLPAHALLRVAQCIQQHPNVGMIYTDEDKIGPDGLRESPFRKTPWHPDLLAVENTVSHLGVYRTELMRAIGGFRQGLEGAQDHDLALRCSEQLQDDQIVHIPEILYHWRMHAESTSSSLDAKPYALVARQRCLQEHQMRLKTRITP
jgi:O-antigen biosynthesis protein